MIHFKPNSNGTYGGTCQFEEPIAGLIFDDRAGRAGLDNTDGLLGLDTVVYPGINDARSCIVEGGDALWVSEDGKSLSVTLMGPEQVVSDVPLADPGFETMTDITGSTSPWFSGAETNPSVDEVYIDSTYARTGSNCVSLGIKNDLSTLNQNVAEPVDTKATYLFKAWVRTLPGKASGSVGMRFLSGPGRNIDVRVLTLKITSAEWSQCMVRIRPEDFPDTVSTGDPVRLRFFHAAGNTFGVLLDDVTLTKVTGEPTGGIDEMRVLTPVPASEDMDIDGLGDAWEYQYFGDLAAAPADPAPGGAGSVLEAYGFGMDPAAGTFSPLMAVWDISAQKPSVTFTRARDAGLTWICYLSSDLHNWDVGVEGVDYQLSVVPGSHHFTEDATLDIIRPFSDRQFVRIAFEMVP
jgi:hypothetical protein